MLSKLHILCTVLIATATHAAESPTGQNSFEIMQFLDPKDDPSIVVISAGSEQGIVDGAIFKSFRPSHNSVLKSSNTDFLVETGSLKAFKVEDHFTLAHVVDSSTPMAEALFPKFPGVMAGDTVKEINTPINSVQNITPESVIHYQDIFIDPKGQPSSFELSEHGRERLREIASAYSKSRAGTLLVSGFTDHNGPEAMNQVESYQRALTVRQFLISDLGFDKDRIVALGFGEAEPEVKNFAPGYQRANRRITLKIVH